MMAKYTTSIHSIYKNTGYLVLYITYLEFLISDGYDTTQEASNNQQYGK